ncbi:penicillin-binding protein 2 [Candidatus Pelagibacter sp.]|uniref:penicillin-binding protein 2 n=1 Tax=Candidatus Pelagibacter sp. TaxID=2024849 RepID=UPI003F83D113
MINSSSDNVKKLNSINRRMFITGSLKFFIMIGIVSRLFFLQVKENKKYLTLSDKNRIREWKLAPVRGEFHDYFGNVIAGNFEAYQLHLIPEQVEDFRYVIYRLKDLLELSDNEFKKVLKKKNEIKPWETLIVSDNLSWQKFSKINNHLYDLNGVKPVISISRNYPFKENFTHLIGYVSQANQDDIESTQAIKKNFVPGLKVGKVGLEKTFEEKLIGTNDIERYEVNAYGRRISQLEFQKGEKGKTLRLTIDTEVQKLANELLKDKAGSICVMDIYTGAVIAMHSSPSFDPNLFVFGIGQDDWQLIRNDPMKPLVNKTLQGNYSPGSTIKPIVALSALENGIVNTSFTVRCTGKTEMYGQTYHCWKKKGHGYVSLRNAMKQSCDTYFYEVARKLGVDKLSETAKKFGLGEKVFGDLFDIEKKGLIPNTQWKKNALGKGWLLGETIITGIGQGYIQTTPIQLCLMTAQIANGGYKIYPHLVIDDKLKDQPMDKFTPLYKNSKNIKIVQDAIFGSTNEVMGTSYRSRIDNPKYQFAGKTGTAQVKKITEEERELDLKTFQIPYEQRDHALYVAFGPYKNPRYALSVIVEHGGNGSTTAAPMATKLFKLIIDRHKIRESLRNKMYLEI